MSSVKLFSERLNKLDEVEKRLTECETKISQLINEITPILTSHANALKELMKSLTYTKSESG